MASTEAGVKDSDREHRKSSIQPRPVAIQFHSVLEFDAELRGWLLDVADRLDSHFLLTISQESRRTRREPVCSILYLLPLASVSFFPRVSFGSGRTIGPFDRSLIIPNVFPFRS